MLDLPNQRGLFYKPSQILNIGRSPIQVTQNAIIFGCVLITALAVFVPLNPRLPTDGLDGSYEFAANQAVAQGLIFGKDILITWGPYGSVGTEQYHPNTDHLMVLGGLFIGGCYAFLLMLLTIGTRLHWLLLYLAAFIVWTPWGGGSAKFFSYPLILLLVCYRVSLPSSHVASINLSQSQAVGLTVCLAALGLLTLVKAPFLLLSWLIAICCFLLFWHRKQKLLAYLSILTPLISTPLFWSFSGQPILALPHFLLSIPLIVSGYAEAMAIAGDTMAIALYAIAAVTILFTVSTDTRDPLTHRAILFLSYGLFLFFAFKQGFVRHDGHALVAGASIIVAALSTKLVLKERGSIVALFLSVLACGYIDKAYVNSSTGSIPVAIRHIYSNAWSGLKLRWAGGIKSAFDERIDALKLKFPISQLPGTTDIYSFQQSYLLASGNKWAPRPMPQSLTAYNPVLAKLNEEHLRHEKSPDNILFRIESIDARFPALEDGLSWPTLINGYYATKFENDLLYLKKRTSSSKGTITEFYNGKHKLDDEIVLPMTGEPIFAEVMLIPTFMGRIASILFKPPQLYMSVTLSDGTKRDFRFVASMARSRFLVSPLVENTRDFVFFTAPDERYFANNMLKTIKISGSRGKSVLWNRFYSIKLSQVDLLRDTNLADLSALGR